MEEGERPRIPGAPSFSSLAFGADGCVFKETRGGPEGTVNRPMISLTVLVQTATWEALLGLSRRLRARTQRR